MLATDPYGRRRTDGIRSRHLPSPKQPAYLLRSACSRCTALALAADNSGSIFLSCRGIHRQDRATALGSTTNHGCGTDAHASLMQLDATNQSSGRPYLLFRLGCSFARRHRTLRLLVFPPGLLFLQCRQLSVSCSQGSLQLCDADLR
jgi:hypothetical protein